MSNLVSREDREGKYTQVLCNFNYFYLIIKLIHVHSTYKILYVHILQNIDKFKDYKIFFGK